MTFRFKCKVCDLTHEGLPAFGADAPYAYEALDDQTRAERAVLGTDNCEIDDSWVFVRGMLEIPIDDLDEPFVWLVWCSLSLESYEAWVNSYELEKRSHIGPFFGWLNTQLPFYDDTLDLKTTVHLRDDGIRPLIEIQQCDHQLFLDQRQGVSRLTVEHMMQGLLHGI